MNRKREPYVVEHPTVNDTLRFMEHEIARTLPRDFGAWEHSVFGCDISISLGCPEFHIRPVLLSIALDFKVMGALIKMGVDVPCKTIGDAVEGKFGIIPPLSVEQFKNKNKERILEFLEAKNYNSFITNDTFTLQRYQSERPVSPPAGARGRRYD
jgi:hypothetical protein